MSWHTLICSAFRRLRQENNKFVAILGYMMRSWIWGVRGSVCFKEKERREGNRKEIMRKKSYELLAVIHITQ